MQPLIQKTTVFLIIIFLFIGQAAAQGDYSLRGKITDEYNHPLAGASVMLPNENAGTITNRKGEFAFSGIANPSQVLKVSFMGYQSATLSLELPLGKELSISLRPHSMQLGELTVTESNGRNAGSSMSLATVDKAYLQTHASGSLMQSLSRLPGVASMDIGSGQSKPAIRGMGFNRVVVAENGIKHQAQEWGADHGLEIDPFAVERIEITKGPASLMYGANAIGGVIDMKQIVTPEKNSIRGDISLQGHSNQELFGFGVKMQQRFDKWYYRLFASVKSYGDYAIPADSITYMTYNIPLDDRRLRNTAGMERSYGISTGYIAGNFASHWQWSHNQTNSGFFANAHGIEIRNSQIDYDASHRDIDLPSQGVRHDKLLNNNILTIQDYKLNIDWGYQRNYRQEFSEAVAHGYMPLPPDSLERLYNKSTWTANLKLQLPKHDKHQYSAGANAELQQNKTGGWGFLLPGFSELSAGAYLLDEISFTEKWKANVGVRYDYIELQTRDYFDWYATPQSNGAQAFVQRAAAMERSFHNLSWAAGIVGTFDNATLKMNAGKSFRTPTAKELASNGINYHMYRFERGDSSLRAEVSYQLDVQLVYNKQKWSFEFSPFVNYFPNYIYLNPTPDYYEAQQIYNYSQSKVFRTGGEMVLGYDISQSLNITADLEYVFSRQLSGAKRGYTLPFSPPLRTNIALQYKPAKTGIFEKPGIGIDFQWVAAQNDIVPPEKKTGSYALLHLNAGSEVAIGKFRFSLNLELKNAFNTRYYDHTSFYRLIEVPGMGRNLIAVLNIPFN